VFGHVAGPDFDSLQSAFQDPPTLDAYVLIAQALAQSYGARVIGALESVGANSVRITLSTHIGGGKPSPLTVTVDGSLGGALGLKGAFAVALDRALSNALKGSTP